MLAILVPRARTPYRLLTNLARVTVRSGQSKGLIPIVLRHQLGVLQAVLGGPL